MTSTKCTKTAAKIQLLEHMTKKVETADFTLKIPSFVGILTLILIQIRCAVNVEEVLSLSQEAVRT